MVLTLEELFNNKEPLNNSKHDNIIKLIKNHNEISPNIKTLFNNAHYKLRRVEGEIDLLQLLYDSRAYPFIDDYHEVSPHDATLLLFEVKTNDTTCNYHKAKKQLKKSKQLIIEHTPYYTVDCFYAFGVGNGYAWRLEKE